MAAVLLSACERYIQSKGEVEEVVLKCPSSMDSNDTIDLTALLDGRTVVGLYAWDATSKDVVTCTLSTNTITVDASGGTTNHVYYVTVRMVR